MYAGHPHDMRKLKKLSKKYKFIIIEDASHALGAKYFNHPVGNCKYSDITVFSMHPVKTITSGEGGVVTTNNKKYFQKMKVLTVHGITKDKKDFKFKRYNATHYEQHFLGYNYKLSDIQSALGNSQLQKINFFIKQRRRIKSFYNKNLIKLPLILPTEKKNISSSWHLYPVLLDKKKTKKNRDELLKHLRRHNILANVHYIPIHYHPYYKNMGFKKNQFQNSVYFYNNEISLPIYVSLKNSELNYIVKIIKIFFKK